LEQLHFAIMEIRTIDGIERKPSGDDGNLYPNKKFAQLFGDFRIVKLIFTSPYVEVPWKCDSDDFNIEGREFIEGE